MTVTMSLEIESGIALGEVSQVLSEFGADVCSESDGVSGDFEISNTYFVFCETLWQRALMKLSIF